MNGTEIFAGRRHRPSRRVLVAGGIILFATAAAGNAQAPGRDDVAMQDRVRALTDAMNRVEVQMQESQRELAAIRQELTRLREAEGKAAPPEESNSSAAADLAAAVAELRETQTMQETQIATLDQTKVESTSKYPLKFSGMILMNGFVNTRQVDSAATPTVALTGSGSTGASLRQSIFGLDAEGPHVLGASTHGDLRIDMDASASGSGYSGSYALGLLRLRTAHLDLDWSRAEAFFALDRPLLSPDSPSSLIAVAEPALAWSGNLWAWNPQAGFSYDAPSTRSGKLRVQAALIDIADPPLLNATTPNGSYAPPSTAELSRWPGVEGHIGYENDHGDNETRFGIGGLFASHRTADSYFTFDSWASSADFRVPVSRFTQISGDAYWGSALGGLGGGAYKDYVESSGNGESYYRALDDRGGWVQWKQKAGERLEFNEAFGIDNVPAHQLRPYASTTPVSTYNLARNRTFTGNVIYSPSAYLLFSLEYRRIESSYVTAPTAFSDVIGIGAGYKF